MKVLVCHNFYTRPGGEDRVYADETALLETHGHAVTRFERHNDAIADMGRARLVTDTFWSRETERALDGLIRAERPDVMHCHNTFPLISPSAYAAAKAHGVAVVQTLHNYRLVCPKAELMREGRVCEKCLGRTFAAPAIRHACYRGSRSATATLAAMLAWHRARGTLEHVDRFIVPTVFVKAKMVEGGLAPERITPKPNFVSGTPEPGEGAKGGRKGVVFVGRLSPEKGVNVLLDAWSRLKSDVELRILGDGPLAPDVAAAAERDRRIVPLGHRDRDAVMDEIGAASLLVMPSVWYETFGLCIVEAYAKGTPVIASDLGAMAELVDETTGRRVPPGDAGVLARTVDDLLSAPEQLAAMRRAARARYEASYSAEANYPLLAGVYAEAMERAAATSTFR